MGRKARWFDTVQRILSISEPDPVETHTDAKVTTICIVFPLLSVKIYWAQQSQELEFQHENEGCEAERQTELQEDMAIRQIKPVWCFHLCGAGARCGGSSASSIATVPGA